MIINQSTFRFGTLTYIPARYWASNKPILFLGLALRILCRQTHGLPFCERTPSYVCVCFYLMVIFFLLFIVIIMINLVCIIIIVVFLIFCFQAISHRHSTER